MGKQRVAEVVTSQVGILFRAVGLIKELSPPTDDDHEYTVYSALRLLMTSQMVVLMALGELLQESDVEIEIPQAFRDAFTGEDET